MSMVESRENLWDEDWLREIHTLPLDVAQERAIELIKSGSTKPSKKAHLIRDFQRARTSAEVSRILYAAYLSGSGLGMQGSSWSKLHNSL